MVDKGQKADPEAIHEVSQLMLKTIGSGLRRPLENLFGQLVNDLAKTPYSPDEVSISKRALKNVCLSYLGKLNDPAISEFTYHQFKTSLEAGGNMTDTLGALSILASIECPEREMAFVDFEEKWQHDTLGNG